MPNQESIEDRAKQADKIIRNPGNYKICHGCESIVLVKACTCPNCAAYRFEEAVNRIIVQARLLGGRVRTSVLAADLE